MKRGVSGFFKYVGQTLAEPTKLSLIIALLAFFGISYAMENIRVFPGLREGEPPQAFVGAYAYFYDILIDIGFAIILATSLNLVNGHTGQFSLGHAGFMAVGAYIGSVVTMGKQMPFLQCDYFAAVDWGGNWIQWATLTKGLMLLLQSLLWVMAFAVNCVIGVLNSGTLAVSSMPEVLQFPLALIIGGVMAALTGFCVGVPSLRLRGDYLAIVTLGFNQIILVLVQNCPSLGGATGVTGIPHHTNFFWTFAFVALTIYTVSNLVNSTFGRGFLAVRDDEIAAEAMGINTTRYKVLSFVIAAFFAGIAGGLYAHFRQFINPDAFNFQVSIIIVMYVIVGGLGSTWGVVFAAILLKSLDAGLRELGNSNWIASTTQSLTSSMTAEQQQSALASVKALFSNRMIFFSIILIAVMLLRPQGLFGVKTLKKGAAK